MGKSRARNLVSRTFATLVRTLISYDKPRYYNGGNCYRHSYVLRYHTEGTGFGFQAELLTRVLDQGASFVEIDAVSYERKAGHPEGAAMAQLGLGRLEPDQDLLRPPHARTHHRSRLDRETVDFCRGAAAGRGLRGRV